MSRIDDGFKILDKEVNDLLDKTYTEGGKMKLSHINKETDKIVDFVPLKVNSNYEMLNICPYTIRNKQTKHEIEPVFRMADLTFKGHGSSSRTCCQLYCLDGELYNADILRQNQFEIY